MAYDNINGITPKDSSAWAQLGFQLQKEFGNPYKAEGWDYNDAGQAACSMDPNWQAWYNYGKQRGYGIPNEIDMRVPMWDVEDLYQKKLKYKERTKDYKGNK